MTNKVKYKIKYYQTLYHHHKQNFIIGIIKDWTEEKFCYLKFFLRINLSTMIDIQFWTPEFSPITPHNDRTREFTP